YRGRFESTPDTLTNPILLGTVLAPLGLAQERAAAHSSTDRGRPQTGPRLGQLPLARRDIERLHQLLGIQRRLRDLAASPRAKRALVHRNIFRDALTWMEIHGQTPDVVAHWK